MSQKTLAVYRLSKSYGNYQLGPLDLELEPGKILGLIGPNGAGKTTLLHAIMTIIQPDAGDVSVMGQRNDPNQVEWKQKTGFVPDDPFFYEKWNCGRNLSFVAQLYPTWDDDYAFLLANKLNLDLSKKAKELSRGNRVKLSLIMALAHRPNLCLFDEPTSGLDPLIRNEVLEVLEEMVTDSKMSILYSTHILSDVERLADELAFLVDGDLRIREEKKKILDEWICLHVEGTDSVFNLDGQVGSISNSNEQNIISNDYEATIKALNTKGIKIIRESKPTLDEIALSVMKVKQPKK